MNATVASGNGCIVTWEAPQEINLKSLVQAMQDLGFDTASIEKMLPRNAFARAAKHLRDERIIRKLEESDEYLIFQFTKEYLDAHEFRYEKEAVLTLDKINGQIECSDETIKDLAEKLMDEEMSKRYRADITRWIKKLFEQQHGDLVPLRKSGGVYYVPESHQEIVDKLNELLERIGGELNVFRFAADSQTKDSVAKAMANYLADLIGEFEESVSNFSPDTKDFLVERRQIQIAEMKMKLEQYETVLGNLSQLIRRKLQAAEQEMLSKLQGNLNKSLVLDIGGE